MSLETDSELELARAIIKQWRDVYSSYGVLVTPPGHPMWTRTANDALKRVLNVTSDYLRAIK